MQNPASFLYAMGSHLYLASGAVSLLQTKKQPCAMAAAVLVSKGWFTSSLEDVPVFKQQMACQVNQSWHRLSLFTYKTDFQRLKTVT